MGWFSKFIATEKITGGRRARGKGRNANQRTRNLLSLATMTFAFILAG
jgi:hypothetical protein